jgi:hypothetical protein
MRTKLIAAACLAMLFALLFGAADRRPGDAARELVAARRATEPATRPSGFGGSPQMWVEASDRSVWMQQGSTCWSTGTSGGCADSVGFSCRADAPWKIARFDVRPGEPIWLHLVGPDATIESLGLEPEDVAASSADVEPVATDTAHEWLLRAPNADALLQVFVRGTAGGDSSYGVCLDVSGDPPADAEPVDVTSTKRLIRSRAQAELKWRIETDTPNFPLVSSSVQCVQVRRPSLSASLLWRCSSLSAKHGASRGMRSVGIVAQFMTPTLDRSNRTIAYMVANVARTRRFTGTAAVRGYLMERAGGGFSICTAGWISMPPNCNGGGVRIRSLDADAYHLAAYGARRYSREEVVVTGRLASHVITADP